MRRGTVAWVLALTGLIAAPAGADDAQALAVPHAPPRRSEFALDISIDTTLPLVVGGTAALQVPGNILVRVGGGIIPGAYVDAINSVGVGWGVYDAGSGQLASLLLNDATVLAFGVGIRPAGTPGIELTVDYMLLWTHRRVDRAQLGDAPGDAGMDVTIDAIHGEVAYQSEPTDHVFLRIAVGWAQAFDHHVSIAGAGDAAAQSAMHAHADALTAAVGRYAFGPSLAASLGVRF